VVLGFELRAYGLLRSCFTTGGIPPALFCVGNFQDRVSGVGYLGFSGLASNHDSPDLCILTSSDYRHEPLAHGQNEQRNTFLTYNPVILFDGIYTKKFKTYLHQKQLYTDAHRRFIQNCHNKYNFLSVNE
jgi:hypothetical protein